MIRLFEFVQEKSMISDDKSRRFMVNLSLMTVNKIMYKLL